MGAMKRIIIPALGAVALAGCQFIPGTDAHKIEAAKKAVAASLKDPTSPLFSELSVVEGGVCGKVNGKNSFGAYAGKTGFIYRSERREVMLENQEHPTNVGITAWNQCMFRVIYAACKTGTDMLAASIDAGSQCEDAGEQELLNQFRRGL